MKGSTSWILKDCRCPVPIELIFNMEEQIEGEERTLELRFF
jgi:hypothetical protein